MAGPSGDVPCKKPCVCGPFYSGGKINYPLWWYGEQAKIANFAGGLATPVNCAWMNHGLYFNGGNSHLLDDQNRRILRSGTTGLWSSINLDGNEAPPCGSICGSGTVLKMNKGCDYPPKITGSLILHSRYCSNLTHLSCHYNSISVLDVSALTSLATLYCHYNSISVLDVSALTSLTALYCYNNSISVLDVSALTSLAGLYCYYNSISVLDVSALTSLTALYCYNNSISVLDVSALTSLTALHCGDNSISVLDVSALTSLTYLRCTGNSMDQAMVDTILCDVEAYGTSNGVLNISDNAVPGAAGITCKDNLIARGWTVTTD